MVRVVLLAPVVLLLGAVQNCGMVPATGAPTVRLPNGQVIVSDHAYAVNLSRPAAIAAAPAAAEAATEPAVAPAAQLPAAAVPRSCLAGKAITNSAADCCSRQSVGGFCVPEAVACAADADCGAGQACHGGSCCAPSGGCFAGAECCSGVCAGDRCEPFGSN